MEVIDAIRSRKSVRSYLDKAVEKEKLSRVLEAARMAPSASNRQEWRFVVVTDPEKRRRLAEEAAGQRFIAEAPLGYPRDTQPVAKSRLPLEAIVRYESW